MLRNNLATRPFYNERAVSFVLALVAIAALALTAFNVTRVVSLSGERSSLQARIDANRGHAATIRQETRAIEAGLGVATLNGLLASTREANALIDERTFSWTVFFDYIERTLPYDVRLSAVNPDIVGGEFVVNMLVVAKRPEDLEAFYDALRGTGAFPEVFSPGTEASDDGTRLIQVQAKYQPPRLPAPTLPVPVETAPAQPQTPATPPANGRAGGSGGRP
jgi:hypothetical protein